MSSDPSGAGSPCLPFQIASKASHVACRSSGSSRVAFIASFSIKDLAEPPSDPTARVVATRTASLLSPSILAKHRSSCALSGPMFPSAVADAHRTLTALSLEHDSINASLALCARRPNRPHTRAAANRNNIFVRSAALVVVVESPPPPSLSDSPLVDAPSIPTTIPTRASSYASPRSPLAARQHALHAFAHNLPPPRSAPARTHSKPGSTTHRLRSSTVNVATRLSASNARIRTSSSEPPLARLAEPKVSSARLAASSPRAPPTARSASTAAPAHVPSTHPFGGVKNVLCIASTSIKEEEVVCCCTTFAVNASSSCCIPCPFAASSLNARARTSRDFNDDNAVSIDVDVDVDRDVRSCVRASSTKEGTVEVHKMSSTEQSHETKNPYEFCRHKSTQKKWVSSRVGSRVE